MTHSPYNQNPLDRLTIDSHESVLGHLLLERQWPLNQALRFLAPTVAAHRKGASLASSVSLTTAIGGGLFAIGGFAFLGVGWAIPAALGAAYNALSHFQNREQSERREAEFMLHSMHPNLSKVLWELHQKGMPLDTLVMGYDRLVDTMQHSLADPHRANFLLDEDAVIGTLQGAIEADLKMNADTILGLPAIPTPAAPLPPTALEQPPVVPTVPQWQSAATDHAAPRVENQASEFEPVDRPSPVPEVPGDSPLAQLMASPFQSRAIFGAQRSGKSYLAAIGSQQLHLTRGTKVFHVNLHSYGEEDGLYWVHAASARGDMGHLPESAVLELIDRAERVVSEFKATKNALLIFDEIILTGATANPYGEALLPLMKEVASICVELASTGKKRQQAIWTLSPDFVAGAVTQETKAIKSLSVGFVAVPKGRTIDWHGQAIKFHAESFGNVQRNWPALENPPEGMDCDRIVWVDNAWLPMGELPPLMEGEAPRISRPDKIARLEASWEAPAAAVGHPEATTEPTDPAIELIQQEPNPAKREALEIAYRWAMNRLENGNDATREAFLNRAKNERKCEYLRENRDDVWEALETLIS